MSDKANKAVAHVLARIINDPRLAYYFDPITESFALLTAAYAEAQQKDIVEVRANIEERMSFAEPRCPHGECQQCEQS